MALEFKRRQTAEGLYDHNERLGEETNERTWSSLSENSYDPVEARKIAESKQRTMANLMRVASEPTRDEEIARQKVLESYENGPSKSHERPDHSKANETLINPESIPTRIQSSAQLPNLNSLKVENERAWFRVASVPSNMSMSERSDTIPPPDNPEEYLFTDENGNNLFAHLANMGINAPEDSNPRKAFAWQIASLDFNSCVKDSFDALSGREKKVFDFDTSTFFQKNKQGVSAVDILVQSGNIAGLTILHNLGNSMQSNHLLRPQVEQVPKWDSSTESHRTKKEQFVVDTSQEGNKLLGNLESTITSSLDIVSPANRVKLEQLIAKYKSQNESVGF